MISLLELLNLVMAILFTLIILHCSFVGLNQCHKHTILAVRFPLVIMLTGASAILLHLIAGNIPHWSITAMLMGFASKLSFERRRIIFTRLSPRNTQRPAG